MKAVVYRGPRDVVVNNVPDAKIEKATDVLVKITTTNICGSDLHMYEGRTNMEPGRIFGHENLGTVVEIGSAVDRVKVGDWVCLPFNIACGFCENCERGLSVWLRRHGAIQWRTGRTITCALCRLQLSGAPARCGGKGKRLRYVVRYLSDRLSRHRTRRRASRRFGCHLRRGAGRSYGGVLLDHQRGQQGHGCGHAQGPTGIGRTNRCYRG